MSCFALFLEESALDDTLGSDAGVVHARQPKGIKTLHPLTANQDVLECAVQSMAQVQSTRNIRRRNNNAVGLLGGAVLGPKTALVHYKKALKVHPDEPYIYYNIGRLHLDMKDIETAKQFFQTALEKDPGFDEAKQVIKAIDLGIV